MSRTLSCALAALLFFSLVGCDRASKRDWGKPTIYRFQTIQVGQEILVKRVFTKHGVTPEEYQTDDGVGAAFVIRDIPDAKTFVKIHQDLHKLSLRREIDMPLERVDVSYGGVSGLGSVRAEVTLLFIGVDDVHIADGSVTKPWREIPIDERGRWTGAFKLGEVVTKNGALFIATRLDAKPPRYWRLDLNEERPRPITLARFKEAEIAELRENTRTPLDGR